jgi:pilus assembly protein CpaE
MQRTIHTCVFNTDERTGKQIHAVLKKLARIRVVSEASSWEQVRDGINNTEVHLFLANLDPDLRVGLKIVSLLARMAPELGIIGISERTDPETIITAMRTGCAQFVCAPIEAADLENAIARIEATRMNVVQASRRICVVGSAGGVGATTIACNLASELAHITDLPTCLVDLNLDFGDVGASFDASPKYSMADVCRPDVELDRTLIEAAMHELPYKVHILGRPAKLENAHGACPERIAEVLHVLSDLYANVVVDLPRACSDSNAAAIEGTDFVLVVAQLQVASVRNAHRVVQALMQMGADEKKIELVVNRFKADHQRITVADVEESFGRPVFAMVPNDYRSVAASLDLGHPILTDAPTSPARIAINKLAQKLAQEYDGNKKTSDDRRSLFGRLLGKKGA